MADCSKITAGLIAATCDKTALANLTGDVVLINYADIDKETSAVASNVISNIALLNSAKGYLFQTMDESVSPEIAVKPGTYIKNVTHSITLRIFIKTEVAKAFVNDLLQGRVVAITNSKEHGLVSTTSGGTTTVTSFTKYEAYGWDAGLIVSELKSTGEFTDGVVYEIKLSSSDKSPESSLPKTIFAGTTAATETLISGLTAA